MSVTQTEKPEIKPIKNVCELYKRFDEEIDRLSAVNQTNKPFLLGLHRSQLMLFNLAVRGTVESAPQTDSVERQWITNLKETYSFSIRELSFIFNRSTETIHNILKETGLQIVEPES